MGKGTGELQDRQLDVINQLVGVGTDVNKSQKTLRNSVGRRLEEQFNYGSDPFNPEQVQFPQFPTFDPFGNQANNPVTGGGPGGNSGPGGQPPPPGGGATGNPLVLPGGPGGPGSGPNQQSPIYNTPGIDPNAAGAAGASLASGPPGGPQGSALLPRDFGGGQGASGGPPGSLGAVIGGLGGGPPGSYEHYQQQRQASSDASGGRLKPSYGGGWTDTQTGKNYGPGQLPPELQSLVQGGGGNPQGQQPLLRSGPLQDARGGPPNGPPGSLGAPVPLGDAQGYRGGGPVGSIGAGLGGPPAQQGGTNAITQQINPNINKDVYEGADGHIPGSPDLPVPNPNTGQLEENATVGTGEAVGAAGIPPPPPPPPPGAGSQGGAIPPPPPAATQLPELNVGQGPGGIQTGEQLGSYIPEAQAARSFGSPVSNLLNQNINQAAIGNLQQDNSAQGLIGRLFNQTAAQQNASSAARGAFGGSANQNQILEAFAPLALNIQQQAANQRNQAIQTGLGASQNQFGQDIAGFGANEGAQQRAFQNAGDVARQRQGLQGQLFGQAQDVHNQGINDYLRNVTAQEALNVNRQQSALGPAQLAMQFLGLGTGGVELGGGIGGLSSLIGSKQRGAETLANFLQGGAKAAAMF